MDINWTLVAQISSAVATIILAIIAYIQIRYIRHEKQAKFHICKNGPTVYTLFNVGNDTASNIKISNNKNFETSAFRPMRPGEYSQITFYQQPKSIYIKWESNLKKIKKNWIQEELKDYTQIGAGKAISLSSGRVENILIHNKKNN